jgi:GNAT superfamily N-acetyltransferase
MGLVTVRSAVSTDIEHIVRIDSCARADETRRTLIESGIARAECLVAFDDELPVGYGVMSHLFFNRGFVSLIYVDAAHRRQRVATRLFDEFERRCRSNRIFTSTNLSNLTMQGLLASRGYGLSGMVQDLDEGDPEMFYSKKLAIRS